MEILQPGRRLIVLGTIFLTVLMRCDAGRCFPVVTPECQDETHNQENGVPSPEINHGGLLPDAQHILRPEENQGGDLPDTQFIPPPVGDYGVPPADGNYGIPPPDGNYGIPPPDGNYGIPQQDGNYGTPPQNGKDPKCFYVRIREDFQHPPDYPEYVDIPDGHSVYERAGHRESDRMQVPDPYWVRPPKHKSFGKAKTPKRHKPRNRYRKRKFRKGKISHRSSSPKSRRKSKSRKHPKR